MSWVLPDCSICYVSLSTDLTVLKSCGHVFHGECLSQWFSTKNSASCPLCRVKVQASRGLVAVRNFAAEGGSSQPVVEDQTTLLRQILDLKRLLSAAEAKAVAQEIQVETATTDRDRLESELQFLSGEKVQLLAECENLKKQLEQCQQNVKLSNYLNDPSHDAEFLHFIETCPPEDRKNITAKLHRELCEERNLRRIAQESRDRWIAKAHEQEGRVKELEQSLLQVSHKASHATLLAKRWKKKGQIVRGCIARK